MPEPADSYSDVVAALERLGVEWGLAGALAAERYRLAPRHTTDVDLLVSWKEGLLDALTDLGFELRTHADPDEPPHVIRARRTADSYLDLLVALTPYQEEALERAVDNGHILTVEDVLVHKVIAWRPRDLDDIASILAAGAEIDWGYVERWVAYFGFAERLEKINRP